MKLTTGIIFLGMVAGSALAQNPAVINNTRNTLQGVQQKGRVALVYLPDRGVLADDQVDVGRGAKIGHAARGCRYGGSAQADGHHEQ